MKETMSEGSAQASRWAEMRESALRDLGGDSAADALNRLTAQHPSVVPTVLNHLQQRLSDDEIVAWLTVTDTWSCRGKKPIDLLAFDPEATIEAARHAVAPSWD